MGISDAFDELSEFDGKTKWTVLALCNDGSAKLLADLPRPFLDAYVAAEHLRKRSAKHGESIADVVRNFVPEKGHIKSGDFGEILVMCLLREIGNLGDLKVPLKWRWKADSDTAAGMADIVLFAFEEGAESPNVNDLCVCVEVKAKATKSDKSPIQDAIDHSFSKDEAWRLAKMLPWLRKLSIAKFEVGVSIAEIERFYKLEVEFRKHFIAAAVIEEAFVQAEFEYDVAILNPATEIMVVRVPDLKAHYEALYESLPNVDLEAE